MFFSVLVPVYNAEPFLKDCMDSVLRQSEQDFEIILVNDGSVDGGGMICDRYRALHAGKIKVLHQPNRGLISARRAGINAAEGEYCIFLDADDTLEPDALAVIRETIAREQADIVVFNYYNRYEPEFTTAVAEAVFADNTVFRGEAEKKPVYTEMIGSWRLNNLCTKAIRSPLVKQDDTPYEEYAANPHTEDLLQSLYPVTHAETIVYRSVPLYNYRRIQQSISTRVLPGKIDKQFNDAVMNRLRAYMTLWGMDTPEQLERFHARKINGLITLFWQHYRAADGDEEKRAMMDYPWGTHLDAEDLKYATSAALPRMRRIQLDAILHHKKHKLDWIARIGEIRMRASHGE
ncbi:MAG: glycosyltransferase family 2 protein [Eubacteriales bacterium]|nr:glycosyltransferase family 2 protein [Eubacteriales bacterium]